MIEHTYILVTSDDQKEAGFKGELIDFACSKLNEYVQLKTACRVINIESSSWVDEMRPEMCNSSTWYKRKSIQLSVWYEQSNG